MYNQRPRQQPTLVVNLLTFCISSLQCVKREHHQQQAQTEVDTWRYEDVSRSYKREMASFEDIKTKKNIVWRNVSQEMETQG